MGPTERQAARIEVAWERNVMASDNPWGHSRQWRRGYAEGVRAVLKALGVSHRLDLDSDEGDVLDAELRVIAPMSWYDPDAEDGYWAVSYEDDCGNAMDQPRLFQLANPDELSWFIANRRSEGDETCQPIEDGEARAMRIADVYSYQNISDV